MFTRDELSEDAIRAHAEKTSMLMLNLVHKISDLEDEALEAGEAMQTLRDAVLEAHKQGWEKCREEAAKVAKETCEDVAKGWRESDGQHGVAACFQCEKFTAENIRALEYSNE